MAKCFVHGSTLAGYESKQAVLKIYRDMDSKELSIDFNNSLGAFEDECRRIEARIYNVESDRSETQHYISNSTQLAGLITAFVTGIINQ